MSARDIIMRSGTSGLTPAAQARHAVKEVAKLFDATKCTGCKGCQVACSEWNDLRAPVGTFQGSYQNPMELSSECWTLMQFHEVVRDDKFNWNFTHTACMHCGEPSCLLACSTAGAIIKRADGTVDFDADKCIGCGYCVTACPFNVPKLSPKDHKAYKCTMCADRLAAGMEPSCVKTCVTGALKFGNKEEMLYAAVERVKQLHAEGHTKAGIYDPEGVNGTGMIMILKDINHPEDYGMPKDPQVSTPNTIKDDWVKPLGAIGILGLAGVALAHRIAVGRNTVEEDMPVTHCELDKDDKE